MLRRSSKLFLNTARGGPADYMPYNPVKTNPVVFLDVTIETENAGRIYIELFSDIVPKMAENFRSLCTGERGRSVPSQGKKGVPLYYKGIPFHRIIPNHIVQGGDIVLRDGRGNDTIFGYPLPDESFDTKAGKHLSGTVAMAHGGPNNNGSQFFFNLRRSEQLDGKYVVIGQVLDGWDVVRCLSKCGSRCGTPVQRAWISDCGQSGGVEVDDINNLQNVRALHPSLTGKEVF